MKIEKLDSLLKLSKRQRRKYIFAIDTICMLFAGYIGLSASKSMFLVPSIFDTSMVLLSVMLTHVFFNVLKVYRAIIRHLDLVTVLRVVVAISIASVLWVTIFFFFFKAEGEYLLLVAQWSTAVLLIIGYRIIGLLYLRDWPVFPNELTGVAVFGLEEVSRRFARDLKYSKKFEIKFFLVDDPGLSGGIVENVRVYSLERLGWAVKRFDPSLVVFCCDEDEFAEKREILQQLFEMNLSVRLISNAENILEFGNLIGDARPVNLEDLIGRQRNSMQPALLQAAVEGEHILVTGAAGSVGHQVCKRVTELGPASLTMLDQNETDLLEIRDQIGQQTFPITLYLGSVAEPHFINGVFKNNTFTTVIHAAAYKHVISGEQFPASVIANNIIATYNVVMAADQANVGRMLFISTDKSVEPTSVMGASKQWCEKFISSFATQKNNRNYSSVRFGNVIQSRGSVVPKFEKQIAEGGPITIHDLNMKRYFMSLDEAVDLILQAIPLGTGGETFVLKMGELVAISEIARVMVLLSGKTIKSTENPLGEIEIVEIGPGDGEKLEEKLFADNEAYSETSHSSILVSKARVISMNEIDAMYIELCTALESKNDDALKALLFRQLKTFADR